VLPVGRKANWSTHTWAGIAGKIHLETTKFSATLERRGVTEIGLYSESVLGSATLGTGVTTACRHCKGTVPQEKDKFRICATTWAIS